MKNECRIVEDLLPVYADGLCQEETAEFVSEHLSGCADCARKYKGMSKTDLEEKMSKQEIASAKKPLHKVVIHTGLKTLGWAGGVLAGLIVVFIIYIMTQIGALEPSGIYVSEISLKMPFYTIEYTEMEGERKPVFLYTENGEALDEDSSNYIRMVSLGGAKYKHYLINELGTKGFWASGYSESSWEEKLQEYYEPVGDGTTYVHISDVLSISTGGDTSLKKLKENDRKAVREIAASLAFIDETVAQYAIREYRDVFTEQVAISGIIEECPGGGRLGKNAKTLTLHFTGTGTGKDGKTVTVDDSLIFDITDWMEGRTPTYTIRQNRN